MPPALGVEGRSAAEIRTSILGFLANCRQPALLERGEELLTLETGNFALGFRGSRLTIEAWDTTRNLTRGLSASSASRPHASNWWWSDSGARKDRCFCSIWGAPPASKPADAADAWFFGNASECSCDRSSPDGSWRSSAPKPTSSSACCRRFREAFCSRASTVGRPSLRPPEGDEAAALSFGLIWLSYLRARERRTAIAGLAIYVPAGREQAAALRLLCLDPRRQPSRCFLTRPKTRWRESIPAMTATWTHAWSLAGTRPGRRGRRRAVAGHSVSPRRRPRGGFQTRRRQSLRARLGVRGGFRRGSTLWHW